MIMISPYQLFSLMVLYQFGTTVIFGFASGAGRDALPGMRRSPN